MKNKIKISAIAFLLFILLGATDANAQSCGNNYNNNYSQNNYGQNHHPRRQHRHHNYCMPQQAPIMNCNHVRPRRNRIPLIFRILGAGRHHRRGC
jgi:hypothetical protein